MLEPWRGADVAFVIADLGVADEYGEVGELLRTVGREVHPSIGVGSTDGTSILRDDAAIGGRPQLAANAAKTEGKVTMPMAMQSRTDTSTWPPTPVWSARHHAASAPTAA